MSKDKNRKGVGVLGAKAVGMLKNLPSFLKRSAGSRACIDTKKSQGISGKQARQECRQIYGSRLGNAGRQLGILPKQSARVQANRFEQARSLADTPSKLGTVNEFAFGGASGSTDSVKAGFNYLYLLPLLLFVPQIQKLFK
tara:strand:- start:364 stop:786 length:423 start_codon:yes stop_codon:yes gene_type:complete